MNKAAVIGAAGIALVVLTACAARATRPAPEPATGYVANAGSATVTPVRIATGIPGTPIKTGTFPVDIALASR